MIREGLLIRVEPRAWTVEVDGVDVPCSLKPRLFERKTNERNPVAVGDRVLVRLEEGRGVIEEVLPRRNRLARPAASDPAAVQVTAANVDLLVIVVATQDPPPRLGLIDRCLVAAERQGMEALIVVNKVDRGRPEEVRARLARYPRMGYPVVFTSALTGSGVEEFGRLLAARTSLLVGHSGAGKTSLMNRLDPGLELKTGRLAKHGRGRHTTTSVSLWRLPNGGHVVDTPGVRGFGLVDVPAAELAILMPDLRPFTGKCRFPDCTHDHEPNCGVLAALARGEIDEERYASYLRMLHGVLGDEVEGEGGDS
ncbi:MAG: ribosome small subunit-dependent GTPase A [Planctomycetes bacterium]|nr:ribosome small subunit-dependent GTPase A [Planctomycetota bacterium]